MKTTYLLKISAFLLVVFLFISAASPAVSWARELPIQSKTYETLRLPESARQFPVSSLQSKGNRHPKLDSALVELAQAALVSEQAANDLAASRDLRLQDGRVQVQIVPAANPALAASAVRFLGGEITGESKHRPLLQGWLPPDALIKTAELDSIAYIRQPAMATLFEEPLALDVTSEGLSVINGQSWHTAGYLGTGAKIAIVDGGFTGYTALKGTELPSIVIPKNFVDGQDVAQVDGGTIHGTACAEVVYDIAPQATMYLVKIASDVDLEEAVAWLISQDVDVISTSLGFFNVSPGDGTGPLADLALAAHNNGILWVTAAGNSRIDHWGGAFLDTNMDGAHEWAVNQNINMYGPGDGSGYLLPVGTPIVSFLRWDDWEIVDQDYDLYLFYWDVFQASWVFVTGSEDVQSGFSGQTPTEYIGIYAPIYAVYGFLIMRYHSNRAVNLEFFAASPADLDKRVPARSLANLADAPDTMTVAAVDVETPFAQEVYSSEGPTNGPGGTADGGFLKPDIAAYANVSTATYGPLGFNGTSAATPHVAGSAALVKSAAFSFTPTQIQDYLQSQALDLGVSGPDTLYGSGRLYLGNPAPFFTPPTITGLPDQFIQINTSISQAIDLWSYTSDTYSTVEQLTYTIDNIPDPNAGVSITNNRYIAITPLTDWVGQTQVSVRATTPYGPFATDQFTVTVAPYFIWNGIVDSDWHNPLNWSMESVPTSADQVLIPFTANQPVLASAGAVSSLRIFTGAILDLSGNTLTIEDNIVNMGTLRQSLLANTGETTSFLRLTNLAGDQVKYLGLDLLPQLLLPASADLVSESIQITVAVGGQHFCDSRYTGVKRCFEIQASLPVSADVTFYYTEVERNAVLPESMAAFQQAVEWQEWTEQPGPYTFGGSDPALYLAASGITELGWFALDASGSPTHSTLLPVVMK